MRMTFDSKRGKLITAGGDYAINGDSNNGNQPVWAIDLAKGTTWEKLMGLCPVGGGLIPSRPDNTTWAYDSKRDMALMIPGFFFGTQGATSGCSGVTETNSAVLFNLSTNKWQLPSFAPPSDGYGGDTGSLFGLYDPVSDAAYRLRGSEGTMEVLHLATNTWEKIQLASAYSGDYHSDQSVIDVAGKSIYVVNRRGPSIIRYSIPDKKIVDSVTLPNWSAPLGLDHETFMVFDPINRVVLYPNTQDYDGVVRRLYVYKVDTRVLSVEAVPAGVSGNCAGFDSRNNAMLFMGRSATNVNWLYRYGTGP